MSHAFYNIQWQLAIEQLNELIQMENPPMEMNDQGKPLPEKIITFEDAYQHYAVLYIRYLQVFRKLEDCHDQIVHPQKRRDIKIILEVVMTRFCQVKKEVIRYSPHQTDYLNLEQLLLQLNLGPEALEVPIPRFFRERNELAEEDNRKRDLLEKCLEEHGMAAGIGDESSSSLLPKMTKEQAIAIIQKNERGRQGAIRAKLMKELRDEDNVRRKMNSLDGGREKDPSAAAVLIQKVFRGYVARIRIQKQATEELIFIGMKASVTKKEQTNKSKYDPVTKEQQIRKQRKTRQQDNELKYIESMGELQKVVMDAEGPEMKDKMWEERYNWWITQKEKTGKYPDDFETYYKSLDPNAGKDKEKKKKSKKDKKDKDDKGKKKKDEKGKKDAKKKGGEEEEEAKIMTGPSELVNSMLECVGKFKQVWSQIDESDNYLQHHDETIAKDKIRPLVREMIRKEVDVRLLAYLENIKVKVAAKMAAGKKGKKGKEKGKKGKKRKERKERQKRKER